MKKFKSESKLPLFLQTKTRRLLQVLIIVLTLPLALFVVQQQQELRQRAEAKAQFHVVANSDPIYPGQELTFMIAVNSQTTPINAVQINLIYPDRKLDILRIDTNESAFDISTQQLYSTGIVQLGREVSSPISGVQTVATISFKAKELTQLNEIRIDTNSYVINAEDNTNILTGTEIISASQSAELYKQQTPNIWKAILDANKALWNFVFSSIGLETK